MGMVRRSEAKPNPFVGRRTELARLQQVVTRVGSGHGVVAWLTGWEGVGKSRLAEAVLEQARARGFQVLQAAAGPLEGGVAYLPLVRALEPSITGLGAPRLEALTRGLPDLARLMPDLPVSAPPAIGDAALEKRRIFEALLRLLERLAAIAPLALFADDLHWADLSSIEFIHYLAQGIDRRPILLLGACREEAVPTAHPLRTLLAGLRQSDAAGVIALPALSRDDIAELVRTRIGGRPTPGAVAVIRRRTGGNLHLLDAMLEQLGEEDRLEPWLELSGEPGVTPSGLARAREGVEQRLARLDPADTDLLEWVAVCPDGAPYLPLREATGSPDAALMAGLRRMLQARLVVEEVRGDQILYHCPNQIEALALLSTLPEVSRRIRHTRWLAALTHLMPFDLQRLAHHALHAGAALEAHRAVEMLQAAGRESLSLAAPLQARRWLSAALGRARQARLSDRIPGLLEALAQSHRLRGDEDQGAALFKEAAEAYQQREDREGMARTWHGLAGLHRQRGELEAERRCLEQGIQALAELPAGPTWEGLQVDLVAHLARTQAVKPLARARRSIQASPQAVKVQCRVGLLEVDRLLGAGAYPEATEAARRAVIQAEGTGDPALLTLARLSIATVSLACGRVGDSSFAPVSPARGRVGDSSLAPVSLARGRVGDSSIAPVSRPYGRTGEAGIEAEIDLTALDGWPGQLELWERAAEIRGLGEWMRGEWDGVLRRLEEAHGEGPSTAPARAALPALALRALVQAGRGELAAAGQLLEQAWELVGVDAASPDHLALLYLAEASLAIEQGEAERALEELTALEGGSGERAGGRLPTQILAVRGLACAESGKLDQLERIISDLRRRDLPESYCGALADHLEGLRLGQLHAPIEAVVHLCRAARLCDGLNLPFEAARAKLALLELAGGAAELREEAGEAGECLEAFRRLGAARYLERAERALAGVPRHRKPGRPRTSLLSTREREVATLVARGLTNDEIGSRLCISTHTVSTHMRRLFERLSLRSRSDLTRYVVEHNLLQEERRSA